MNYFKFFGLGLLALTVFSCNQSKKVVVVTNPTAVQRPDEVLVLTRRQVENAFPVADSSLVPALKENGQFIPSQIDDMDNDGSWDELAFQVSLKPREKAMLNLVYVKPQDYPEFEKRTNVRLGIKQPDGSYKEVDYYKTPDWKEGFKIIAQGESVSWENDKMGFRDYFDCRNVKDLFGKRKPGLIIDKIQTPAMGSYHNLADWGMDILHCGSSLGSGGLALLENDSLYRLGCTDTYEYQKITEGPVRSVFDLKYGGWHVNGQDLSARERITIYPGKYWFKSDVTVSGFTGDKQLVTGIVTTRLKKDPIHFQANSTYDVIATHDVQSLNNDVLGMAVMIPESTETAVGEAPKTNYYFKGKQYQTVPEKEFSVVVSNTYYEAQKIENDQPISHYFFAVWGLENPQWNQVQNFKKYLTEEADAFSNPVQVSIQ